MAHRFTMIQCTQVQHQEPVVALALSPAADLCAVRTVDGATGIMDLQKAL